LRVLVLRVLLLLLQLGWRVVSPGRSAARPTTSSAAPTRVAWLGIRGRVRLLLMVVLRVMLVLWRY
jgi:hypothetical protein